MMDWYSILGVVLKSILWTFVVFCVTWCFFSAYKHWLRCCFLPRWRREEEAAAAADSYGGGGSLPERGLLAWEIEEFPKFGYPPPPDAEGGAGGGMSREITECVVCLGPFKEGETLRLITMCGHVFHADCVDVWLRAHATCPCCRAYLKVASTGEMMTQTTSESPV